MSSRTRRKFVTVEPLEVGDEVAHRLFRDARVQHRRFGAFEEDVGVQSREQQRVYAEFRRDQRKHRRPVGRLFGLRLVAAVRPRLNPRDGRDQRHNHPVGELQCPSRRGSGCLRR